MSEHVSALILAGQRAGVVDPLLVDAGVDWKALLPILGKPMTAYVLAALDASDRLSKPYWVSGLDKDLIDRSLNQSPSEAGPASSVVVAAEAGLPYPFMVTTCDHPLLTSDMVNHFLQKSIASGADFTLGLATKDVIQPAYPHVKRTYLKFKDQHVSGCNLFYVANAKGLEAIKFWRAAQDDRKKPVKLARRLGIGMLLKYITGGLTLNIAFEHASKSLNINAKPIILPFAEAAIDVDKPSDLELVTEILSERNTDNTL
ncbi:MAG: GTP--adenosylcobinamide-phosphate guanylyltransferase [Robiginitomaculum sp.]|nr:MAG: GTP--adenosylcobinamide-phosphate guanylyltransferase [Robiginitomaculum sp.]